MVNDKKNNKASISTINFVITSSEDLDSWLDFKDRWPTPIKDIEPLQTDRESYKCTKIDKQMEDAIWKEVEHEVLSNADLFSWNASNMPGINHNFICHKLAIFPDAKHVAQRKHKLREKGRRVVEVETNQLSKAYFIHEVYYTTSLTNMVMVKKLTWKWWMCVDYTAFKKVCPKDAYPFAYHQQISWQGMWVQITQFLNTYSGYNQIKMYPPDQEKTTLITSGANFCYNVIPFGLEKLGATHHRVMDKVFYADDMIVMSLSHDQHFRDLVEIF